MRPLRLDLAGFTVFRDETTIDFTDADFFALVGPTGSGKSTVLDAICFALYGTVPRWSNRRSVENALAPSTNEARVRLVFESAGNRYIAARVVRRDGKGRVTQAHAGLEMLPEGFDLRSLDDGLTPADLGEVLAGTPSEMEAAVLAAVGLPYEQFTSCVVLPQGAFAEFLHAKASVRQDILISLLGLQVYEEVREQATGRATEAEARLAATDQLLRTLSDADDDALAAATDAATAAAQLCEDVESVLPRRTLALAAATQAATALRQLDDDISQLDLVTEPAGAADLAAAVTAARTAAARTESAVNEAEEREEKLRGQLTGAGDPTAVRLLLDAHRQHTQLTTALTATTDALAVAAATRDEATAAVLALREQHEAATAALELARAAYQEAQNTDRAAALRHQLTVGEPCAVCTQPVLALPPTLDGGHVAQAESAGHAARATLDTLTAQLTTSDKAAREAATRWERARAQHDQRTADLAALAAQLSASPGEDALRRQLAEHATIQSALDDAGTTVRRAREADRAARADVTAAERRLAVAWQQFDAVRDAVAAFGPPTARRDDLAATWTTLATWANTEKSQRVNARPALIQAVADADAALAALLDDIAVLFATSGHTPGDDPGRTAAVARERAEAELRRITDRREQAASLLEQRAEHEADAHVAKALANHLRANNFERWLLAEALDQLVDGASRILRDLTGGQYDLSHEKGEFYVIDHHDAALRRGVRTLSGGETFQASLALALALSEQLAGMSTTAASLESIILDEGFGTLDAATLDTVATTLEALAARGDRMVGVVTHVAALAERVPVRFTVSRDAQSARITRTGL